MVDEYNMEKAVESTEAKKLVAQNLENIYGAKQVESDEALLHKSDTSSLSAHNEQYTALLRAYVRDFENNAKDKRQNKQVLFKIAKRLLFWIPLVVILFIFVTLICIALDKVDVLEALPGLFTALATLLGTFLIVPQMITEYLFNKDEENHLAEIISKIQEYDRDIRGGL